MTLPDERYRALVLAEKVMIELLWADSLQGRLKSKVASALRHYPTESGLARLAKKAPDLLRVPE